MKDIIKNRSKDFVASTDTMLQSTTTEFVYGKKLDPTNLLTVLEVFYKHARIRLNNLASINKKLHNTQIDFSTEGSFSDLTNITINITPLADDRRIKSLDVRFDACLGLAVHEIAHVIYTKNLTYSIKKDRNVKILHSIFNIVEDERIEKLLTEVYSGISKELSATKLHYFKGEDFSKGDNLTAKLINLLCAMVRFPDQVTDAMYKEHETFIKAVTPLISGFYNTKAYRSATKCHELSAQIYDLMVGEVKAEKEAQSKTSKDNDGDQDDDGSSDSGQSDDSQDDNDSQEQDDSQEDDSQDDADNGTASGSDDNTDSNDSGDSNDSSDDVQSVEQQVQQELANAGGTNPSDYTNRGLEDLQSIDNNTVNDLHNDLWRAKSNDLTEVSKYDKREAKLLTRARWESLIRSRNSLTKRMKKNYRHKAKDVQDQVSSLRTALNVQILTKLKTMRNKKSGRLRNVVGAVASGRNDVYIKKPKQIQSKLNVGFIIDNSGSMNAPKAEAAKTLAIAFDLALKGMPSVNRWVFGFFNSYATLLASPKEQLDKTIHLNTGGLGANDDATVVRMAANYITSKTPKGEAVLLITLTDGQPTNGSGNTSYNPEKALRHRIEEAKLKNVHTIGIGLDYWANETDMYEHWISVSSSDPKEGIRKFNKLMKTSVSEILHNA